MGFAGVILDLILMGLLVAALAYGFRLERKLKALRNGQAGFAEAVLALDAAAARAEAGLDHLRRSTEEAQEHLHDRIRAARELKADLERLIERAPRAAEIMTPSALPAAPVPTPRAEIPARPRPTPSEPRRAPARGLDEDLFETASPAGSRAGDRR